MIGRFWAMWVGLVTWIGPPWRRWIHPKAKRFWVVLAVALYALAGFVLAPWIAKRELVSWMETTFERPVELEQLAINPFLLSVDARGFTLTEADGAPIFAFDRFYARLRLTGVFQWAWSFAALELEGADATLVRFEDERTNWGVLLKSLGDADAPAEEPDSDEGGLVRLIVRQLVLTEASAHFVDETRPTTFSTDVGPIDVAVEKISTLPNREGEQYVTIGFEDGGRLAWGGSLSLNPIASSGTVTASGPYAPILHRYFQDETAFEVTKGWIEFSLDYQAGVPVGEEPTAALGNGELALIDLALRMKDETPAFITLPALQLSGGHMAWPEQSVGADALSISGLDLSLWRTEDGVLSTDLLMAPNATTDTPKEEPTETSSDDPLGGWSFTLGQFDLSELSARFEDRALRQPGDIVIARLDLSASHLSSNAETRSPFTLDVWPATGGKLEMEGEARLLPLPAFEASFSGDALRVSTVQPYLADVARVRVENGMLDLSGDVALSEDAAISASGDMEMSGLKVTEEDEGVRVLEAERLTVDRYEFDLAERSLQISDISLNGPYLQLLVNDDSSTNIQQLLVSPNSSEAEQADTTDEAAKTEAPWHIAIGRVGVTNGAADFADRSLPFPFSSEITAFEGEVTTLDSASADPAQLDLQGQVGDYGLAQVDGTLRPFDPVAHTDIQLLFRNIAIPDLSPYTIKFAGRRIARGRMDLDLNYAVEAGALAGENNIVITEIELGETVDQPGAMNLPLGLAIALLKNAEGVIDVDIPVRGDVSDPEFRIGGVVRRAIANVITSVVTSPFRMLGGLVGADSDDFGRIEFEPGIANLTPPEREKLAKLAEALAQRPTLTVQAPGVWVQAVDAPRLQELRLEARLSEQMATDDAELKDDDILLAEQRHAALEALFTERFPEEPLASLQAIHSQSNDDGEPRLNQASYLATLRDRLILAEPVSDTDLAALAAERAAAVVAALTDEGGVAPERVSTLPGRSAEATDQGWAPLDLEVGAATGQTSASTP